MDDPIDFLFSLERLGMKFGLENISVLCASLGHPERAFRSVHVAGTNGKGSVTALVEAALRAAGHRTARYTSPHLVRLHERFTIGGAEVSTEALRAAASRVRETVVHLIEQGTFEAPPTFFECTTAVAFELFREARVDIAVLEVGLGGRLDATNVVMPMVSAITSIDFDHEAQLGSSLASIAREKAGIIKAGVPVVRGPVPEEAAVVIEAVCEHLGSRLILADRRVEMAAQPGGVLDVRTADRFLSGVTLGLEGAHQRNNAAVAIAIVDELSHLGVQVPDAPLREALTDVRWPGRLERFDAGGVPVLLDAAHNPAGAAALAAYLSEQAWHDATLVFGVMADKDVHGMLRELLRPPGLWGAIVCTRAPGERALPAEPLAALVAQLAKEGTAVEAVTDPILALDRARGRAKPVVVAGSIFLIGPLRDILR